MRSAILILFAIFWMIITGMINYPGPELPEKKVSKAISKLWKIEDYNLSEGPKPTCDFNGKWYKVTDGKKEFGLMYSGRVNSCRSGGCSINGQETNTEFEYFDYLLFTDTTGKVLWVKVFNYQATYGHEVMSRGWLNQFRDLVPGRKLNYGKDVEAISGATISAEALTEDIQRMLDCTFKKEL